MSRLTISYEHDTSLLFKNARMSVSIDGSGSFDLAKGESRTVELEDGSYTVLFRCGLHKRTLYLTMDGDDSFIVTWDSYTGGIIIADRYEKVMTVYPNLNRRMFISLAAVILVMIALYVAGAVGMVDHSISSLGFLLVAAAFAVQIAVTIALNSSPLIRE